MDLSLVSGKHLRYRRLAPVLLVVPAAGAPVRVRGQHPAAAAGCGSPGNPARRCRATSAEPCGCPCTTRIPRGCGQPRGDGVSRPAEQGRHCVHPGGPGESGDLILPILASLMPPGGAGPVHVRELRRARDGSSEPPLRRPSGAAAGSAIAGTAAATRTFAGLGALLSGVDPTLFPTVNTTTSAREIIVACASGWRGIDYYGLSYGTAPGSVYALSSRAASAPWSWTEPSMPT